MLPDRIAIEYLKQVDKQLSAKDKWQKDLSDLSASGKSFTLLSAIRVATDSDSHIFHEVVSYLTKFLPKGYSKSIYIFNKSASFSEVKQLLTSAIQNRLP